MSKRLNTCPKCQAPHGMSPGLLCSWCAWGWGRNPSAPEADARTKEADRG